MHEPDELESRELASAEELSIAYDAMMETDAEEIPQEPREPEEPAEETPPPPERIVEALLFVGGDALKTETACEILRGFTPEQLSEAVDKLNDEYRRQGRPYVIVHQENGYIMTLRQRFHGVIEKLYGGVREARLSGAAVDTLAIVAYQQPVSKNEVDNFRGSDSGSHLRQLVRRRLIQIVHRHEGTTREVAYGTTDKFLSMFGLSSLEDLPRTQDLQQL